MSEQCTYYNVNQSKKKIKKLEEMYSLKLSIYKEKWKRLLLDGEKTDFMISNHGNIKNKKTGKYINQRADKGYKVANIRIDGKSYEIRVHRAVATYFCKIPKRHRELGLTYSDLYPNHKDGIRNHNAAFNLEWTTQKENTVHAFRTGLCENSQGEKSHLSTMAEADAIEICTLISEGNNNTDILDYLHDKGKTHITEKHIQHIRSGETWKHISKDYTFPKLGVSVPYSRDEEKIHGICKMLEKHEFTDVYIAKQFGVPREYVKDIRTGRRRRDISSQYNISKEKVSPIKPEQIVKCCEMLADKDNKHSQAYIAKECGISQDLVSYIYNRKRFTDISCKYDF